jgi:hypothetical protein
VRSKNVGQQRPLSLLPSGVGWIFFCVFGLNVVSQIHVPDMQLLPEHARAEIYD